MTTVAVPAASSTLAARPGSGMRKVKDRAATTLVYGSFLLALIPLAWLLWTVLSRGLLSITRNGWFTGSQRGITYRDSGGGALHAIIGTLEQVALCTLISVPISLLVAIYLVEYGRGPLVRATTFMVDILTGIPSIVAALFVYAVFVTTFGGNRAGWLVSLALVMLMIPVVVRTTEEMLRLVPNELREASYALGVPKWRTIVKIVLPTAMAGLGTAVTLAIARVIGETAPLLITVGITNATNTNPFDGRMATLPVYAYYQLTQPGVPPQNGIDRAWTAALVLIVIVLVLNLIARLISRFFAPKTGR